MREMYYLSFSVFIYSLFQVTVTVRLDQNQISWTKIKSQSVSFNCRVVGQCWNNYIHWYQKVEGKPFTRILNIKIDNGKITPDSSHPQVSDFTAVRGKDWCELRLKAVKESHSATYYCACWETGLGRIKVFGSGTTLYVTDNQVQKPNVTVYPVSEPQPDRKTTLLCLARDMFPNLVRFSWKMDKNGQTVEVPKKELEQREEGQVTSMIIIDGQADTIKFTCSVEHEGGTVDTVGVLWTPEERTESPITVDAPTCPPINDPEDMLILPVNNVSVPPMCSVNLASVAYTVMIVKSLVFCCGLSLLLLHRNMATTTTTNIFLRVK